jgi:hypothetical protein
MVKEPLSYAGMGVRSVDTRADLDQSLGAAVAVVEAFISGEEFSVELVCGPAGVSCVAWMAKGRTDGVGHPLDRLRYVPPEPVPAVLRSPCERLLGASGYRGIAEVDLVVRAGCPYVLECNPRTSAVTPAVYFTGRTVSPRLLVGQLLGLKLRAGSATAVAEYGLPEGTQPAHRLGPQAYCYEPPAGTEFDPRVYLWGDPVDLQRRLTQENTAWGAHFADRVDAAAELLEVDVVRPGGGR